MYKLFGIFICHLFSPEGHFYCFAKESLTFGESEKLNNVILAVWLRKSELCLNIICLGVIITEPQSCMG